MMNAKLGSGKLVMVVACALLTLFSSACGDSGGDSGGDNTGSTGSPQAGTPTTPTPAADSTATGTGDGAAGTAAAPLDMQAVTDLLNMFLPECDMTIPTTATCGGVECPANQLALAACIVPCCGQLDGAEVCGTRSADITMPDGECMPTPPPADPDPLCPEFDTGMGGTPLPGCCTEDAVCGVISSLSMQCITESMFITLPADPPPCDGSGLTADTGMDMPDAGAMDAPDAGM